MRQWHSLTSEAGDPTQLTSTWQLGRHYSQMQTWGDSCSRTGVPASGRHPGEWNKASRDSKLGTVSLTTAVKATWSFSQIASPDQRA